VPTSSLQAGLAPSENIFLTQVFHIFSLPITEPVVRNFSISLYILFSHGTVEAAYFFLKPFRDFPPRPTSTVQKFFK
jgi:hypothetical protein